MPNVERPAIEVPEEAEVVSSARLETLSAYASTRVQTIADTVAPPREPSNDASREALEAFEELGEILRAKGGHGLVEGRTLGEGGMGIVRLARQVALGREVALKTLKASAHGREQRLDLLREAWITGSLEHPNVVPVYDVAMDGEGGPAIVLKRIEGEAWSAVMHDAESLRARFGATDPLEWNLRTLVTVANAVAFAHERGIVHRDLKPENVMLGRFGEVYVLDWGIAVTTRGDDGRLPHASAATAMAGTPNYMAPEMLGDAGVPVGPHSDVYLLGGILHEILTGRPPHEGTSLVAIFASVVRSEFAFDGAVPEEIAAVCRRALAREPADRFPGAEAFRVAIGEFLQHRGSHALAAKAHAHRAMLAEARASGAPPEVVQGLLGECRFGYRAALEAWEGNEAARRGLDDVLGESAADALARGQADTAALLLAECATPPRELVARVEAARAEAAREEARLGQLALDNDVSIGRRTRLFLMLILGALWTAMPTLAQLHPERVVAANVAAGSVLTLALAAALWVWARESMSKTLLNRRLGVTVAVILTFQFAVVVLPLRTDVTLAQVLPLFPALYTMGSAAVATWVDARTWPATAFGALATLLALVKPEYTFLGIAVYSFVQTVAVVAVWLQHEDVVEEARRIRERRRRRP